MGNDKNNGKRLSVKKAPTLEQVLSATSDYFNLTIEQMKDCSKKDRHIVYARHLAMYIAYRDLHMGGSYLAKVFGYKSHASVGYARRQVDGWLKYNKTHTKRDLTAIQTNLKQK